MIDLSGGTTSAAMYLDAAHSLTGTTPPLPWSVSQIADNSAAPPICNATCADHGGWDGQWTNQYPAARGMSVCGCNARPAS